MQLINTVRESFRKSIHVSKPALIKYNVYIRVMQAVFGLIAFGTGLVGHTSDCAFAQASYQSQSQANFLWINGLLVSLLVPVWTFLTERKKIHLSANFYYVAFDLVAMVFCFSAGAAGAAATVLVEICHVPEIKEAIELFCSIGCGNMKASIAFNFILFFSFIVTALTAVLKGRQFSPREENQTEQDQYQMQSNTPTQIHLAPTVGRDQA